jgi:hypothetical protein
MPPPCLLVAQTARETFWETDAPSRRHYNPNLQIALPCELPTIFQSPYPEFTPGLLHSLSVFQSSTGCTQ